MIDYLLEHTAAIMHKQSDQILQERLGLGLSQFKIITILQEHPQARQRTLADALGQTEASISRQIKLLAEKGMVKVVVNSKNRREHSAILTAKGTRMGRAAAEVLQDYNATVLEQFSEKQLQQFQETLNKLHSHYCQAGKPYACNHPFDLRLLYNQ